MNKCDVMAQFKIISDKKVRCSHCNNELSNIFGNLKRHLGSKHKMTSADKIISKVQERKIEKENAKFQKILLNHLFDNTIEKTFFFINHIFTKDLFSIDSTILTASFGLEFVKQISKSIFLSPIFSIAAIIVLVIAKRLLAKK
uniref:BED-type domain-containing protein n=1 Tax=Strongyloides venezuelensis TaxID=75913 RepID=A0A0K0FP83_STRVS